MQGNDYELTNKHVEIYNGFTKFVLYGTISVIVILSLMAIFLV
ncbi:MAG: aa3-type cytochrome c oxidase subunit IV [Pseudomonadota bacterium]